jgi:hypothetical protein
MRRDNGNTDRRGKEQRRNQQQDVARIACRDDRNREDVDDEPEGEKGRLAAPARIDETSNCSCETCREQDAAGNLHGGICVERPDARIDDERGRRQVARRLHRPEQQGQRERHDTDEDGGPDPHVAAMQSERMTTPRGPREADAQHRAAGKIGEKHGRGEGGGEGELPGASLLEPAAEVVERRDAEGRCRHVEHHGVRPDDDTRGKDEERARPAGPGRNPSPCPRHRVGSGERSEQQDEKLGDVR